MRVVFTDRAKAGLRKIALFIARDSKTRAQSFVRELREKAEAIAEAPLGFRLVPGFEQSGVRRRAYGNYLIFYVVEADRILVVSIVHAARDYEALLSSYSAET